MTERMVTRIDIPGAPVSDVALAGLSNMMDSATRRRREGGYKPRGDGRVAASARCCRFAAAGTLAGVEPVAVTVSRVAREPCDESASSVVLKILHAVFRTCVLSKSTMSSPPHGTNVRALITTRSMGMVKATAKTRRKAHAASGVGSSAAAPGVINTVNAVVCTTKSTSATALPSCAETEGEGVLEGVLDAVCVAVPVDADVTVGMAVPVPSCVGGEVPDAARVAAALDEVEALAEAVPTSEDLGVGRDVRVSVAVAVGVPVFIEAEAVPLAAPDDEELDVLDRELKVEMVAVVVADEETVPVATALVDGDAVPEGVSVNTAVVDVEPVDEDVSDARVELEGEELPRADPEFVRLLVAHVEEVAVPHGLADGVFVLLL